MKTPIRIRITEKTQPVSLPRIYYLTVSTCGQCSLQSRDQTPLGLGYITQEPALFAFAIEDAVQAGREFVLTTVQERIHSFLKAEVL